jgi:hypothetical protein
MYVMYRRNAAVYFLRTIPCCITLVQCRHPQCHTEKYAASGALSHEKVNNCTISFSLFHSLLCIYLSINLSLFLSLSSSPFLFGVFPFNIIYVTSAPTYLNILEVAGDHLLLPPPSLLLLRHPPLQVLHAVHLVHLHKMVWLQRRRLGHKTLEF